MAAHAAQQECGSETEWSEPTGEVLTRPDVEPVSEAPLAA
jgi:hypothetical protein